MKVLLITNMYPSKKDPSYGVFVRNICSGLINQGCSLDLIPILGKSKNFVIKVIKYSVFYSKILFTNLRNYDFVLLSFPSHTFLPFLIKRVKSNKIIVRLHGSDLLPTKRYTFLKLRQRIVFRSVLKARLIVVPSEYFKNKLVEVLNDNLIQIQTSKIFINPSGGIDTGLFSPGQVINHEFRIGYIGKLNEAKGIYILLKAVENLKFPFTLILIGEGAERKELRDYIKKHKLESRIRIYREQNQESLSRFYNSFSVFVFPTLREQESFGNVAIEALSCGIPVIGSRMAAVRSYIKENFNGYLFEPGNSLELAQRLELFHELSQKERSELKSHAKKSAEKYSRNEVSLAFYSKLKEIRNLNNNTKILA